MTNQIYTNQSANTFENLFRRTLIENIIRRTDAPFVYCDNSERPTVAQLDRMSTARLERINRATY